MEEMDKVAKASLGKGRDRPRPITQEERGVNFWFRGKVSIGQPPTRPPISPLERDEQVSFVGWLRRNNIRHHSIPNSAPGNKTAGAQYKREGLVAGVPDLYVFLPHVTLAIEMKRACGVLSDVDGLQWDWLDALADCPGWKSCVAFGKDAAVGFVLREMAQAGQGV